MINFAHQNFSVATILGNFGMFLMLLVLTRTIGLSAEYMACLFLVGIVYLVYMTACHVLVQSDEVEDVVN